MEKPKLHVYYDGDCPMCQVFADTVAKDEKQVVETAQSTATRPASLDTLLTEIHAVEADGTIRTGPDAVMTALSYRFPSLTPLKHLIRLPLVRPVANLIYNFVARRRKLWFGGSQARVYWLRTLTWLGLLGGLVAVLPLFGSDRSYPLIPIVPELALPSSLEGLLLLMVMVGCVGGIFATQKFPRLALLTLLPLLVLILADYTRLQPWIWHYGALLGLFILLWKFNNDTILSGARWLIAGIYFWSGFQKLNQAFFIEVFPWFTEPLWTPFGETGLTAALGFGLLVPFLEIGISLGLLIKPLRKTALYGALAMLMVVVSSLILRDWNNSVWLWNVILFVMAFTLFAGYREGLLDFLKRSYRETTCLIVIVLFWLIPFLNIFAVTDHYLSWSLYSGHVPVAYIYGEEATLHQAGVPSDLAKSQGLGLLDWTMLELNVVPYPEKRTFIYLHQALCRRVAPDGNIILRIEERDFFHSLNRRVTTLTCSTD